MAVEYLLYTLAGFGLGGVLFSKRLPMWLRSIDVPGSSRDHNPGTANAIRLAGVRIGLMCLALDLAKGVLPLAIAVRRLDPLNWMFALVMLGPVLGHAVAPWDHGRGGKAVAVSFGVLLGLLPYSRAVCLLAGLYVLFSTALVIRPDERRSVVTYFCFGLLALLIGANTGRVPVSLGCLAISCVVIQRNFSDAFGGGHDIEAEGCAPDDARTAQDRETPRIP